MKNKHQIEIMSRYLAFLSFGAKASGLTEESNRAGAGSQLLMWVCDQKTASSEHLDGAYRQAKSAFRQLKKEYPTATMTELLDLLPAYLMEQAMKGGAAQPQPSNQ